MKSKLARMAVVATMAAGISIAGAPAAMAAEVVIIHVHESGPGDAAASSVSDSKHVTQQTLNKPVTTGDISTLIKGELKDSPITWEVEGNEQDQGDES
ncbi:MAG: hypothetical protein ACRDP3_16445 [Streptomyces sp.]|uniref:hypothetical protein n=1 Tax=Streptomyces sp. TaxID=1931 RepID=UPI003D6A5AC4